jgi:16S rRNA G966 N2-methylase RsmD
MNNIYDKTIELIENIPSNVVHFIIVEHMSAQKMPEQIGQYTLLKIKKFGKSTLSYYK